MDLQQLRDLGAFVPHEPVTKTVSWTRVADDGNELTDTFTVRIKKHSAGDMERLWSDARAKPDRSHMAALISASVLLGDEGDDRLTYDQAYALDLGLAEAILDAIDTVNPFKQKRGTPAKN